MKMLLHKLSNDSTVRTGATEESLDYYGIVLPSEVIARMDKLNASVNSLELDLFAWADKKYGLTDKGPPPKYTKSWEAEDLTFVQGFDNFASAFRKTRSDYEAQSEVERWVLSNSLSMMKQVESYEIQYNDYRDAATKRGIAVSAPKVVDKAKTPLVPDNTTIFLIGTFVLAAMGGAYVLRSQK